MEIKSDKFTLTYNDQLNGNKETSVVLNTTKYPTLGSLYQFFDDIFCFKGADCGLILFNKDRRFSFDDRSLIESKLSGNRTLRVNVDLPLFIPKNESRENRLIDLVNILSTINPYFWSYYLILFEPRIQGGDEAYNVLLLVIDLTNLDLLKFLIKQSDLSVEEGDPDIDYAKFASLDGIDLTNAIQYAQQLENDNRNVKGNPYTTIVKELQSL